MAKMLVFLIVIYGVVVLLDKSSRAETSGAGEVMVVEEEARFVSVYGREDCGYTQKMIGDLEREGMEYRFFSVDDRKISDPMHARMQQKGIDVSYYLLPVVEV